MESEAAQVEVGEREEVSLADGAGISSANTASDSMTKVACATNGEVESADLGSSIAVSASVASDAEPHVEKGQEETADCANANNGHDGSSKPQGATNSVKSGPSKKKKSKKKNRPGAGGSAGPGTSSAEGGVNPDRDGREEDGERDGDSTDAVKTIDSLRAAGDNSALGAQAPQSGAAGGNGAVGTGAAGNPASGAVAGATAGGGIPSEEEIIRTLRNRELERRRAKAGGAQAPFKEHK